MSAAGWRLALTLAAPVASIYASTFANSMLWSFLVLVAVFVAVTSLAEFVFRRGATPGELRRDLEDRTRNSP